MRKKFLFPVLAILAILCFIYLIIPSTIKISAVTNIKCTINELNICLRDESKWHQWLTENKNLQGLEEFQYQMKEQKLNGVDIGISNNNYKLHSSLIGLSLTPDSLMATWSTEIRNNLNPITRIKHYIDASHLERDMNVILNSLKSYASKTINVYGYNIRRTSFDDSLLISIRENYRTIPDLKEQYRLIYDLQQYITLNGGKILDSPMVHISQAMNTNSQNSDYKIQVAIAIDKPIKENEKYSLIRMVHINGKYVVADVIGSSEEIQKAHDKINTYMSDHLLTSPGIPFEIYLTDRIKVTNPMNWITRIYHPST